MIESIGDQMRLEKRRDAGFFPKCKLSLEPDQYMRTHTSGFQTYRWHPAKLYANAGVHTICIIAGSQPPHEIAHTYGWHPAKLQSNAGVHTNA